MSFKKKHSGIQDLLTNTIFFCLLVPLLMSFLVSLYFFCLVGPLKGFSIYAFDTFSQCNITIIWVHFHVAIGKFSDPALLLIQPHKICHNQVPYRLAWTHAFSHLVITQFL